MPKKLMNFGFQLNSEEVTEQATRYAVPVWFSYYPALLDSIFEITYFIGSAKDATSPEGHFYTLGHSTLAQFPYTVRATCILVEKGFYSEAIILVRNLYESLFQLRYFHEHQDKIMHHWRREKPKIQIKTIFEEIAPNFYDEIYGKELSEFAHSGFASSMFRIKYQSSEGSETIMGSKYDEIGCGYLLNKVVVVIFGLLNYVPTLFPQYQSLVPITAENKRIESLAILDSIMKGNLVGQPELKFFYDLVSPLVYI